MTAPLSHIRVLDLTRVLAGPWATQFLADMGAEVIKIERPGEGDDVRGWGPPFAVPPTATTAGMSAYFTCTNRGKQSVTIDVAQARGQDLVRRLAKVSDVVVENYKVGGLARYGLDYAAIKAINPAVIYCSLTGFGQTGPYAERAGYDYLVQGMGGLMSVTGQPDGMPGAGPVKVGVAINDMLASYNAVGAILAALVRRERLGEGAYVDIALLDAAVAGLINQAANYLVAGEVGTRLGNAHPTLVPYQVFATVDGHIILATGNDGQFARFCEVAGLSGLAQDERFCTVANRNINRAVLVPQLAARIARETTAFWIDALERRAVPCGPINAIDQVFADPQVVARGMRRVLEHPAIGEIAVVANPVRLSGHDTTAQRPPPQLGEDTEQVLGHILGLTPADCDVLRRDGVI